MSFKLTRWNNRPAYCTAELFVPVIIWLLIQFRIYTTLCKRDLSVKQSQRTGSTLHEPLGECNYCRSATKQSDIYNIPGNQFLCNNFERTFKVAQKVYWTSKSSTLGATKQLDISHIPGKQAIYLQKSKLLNNSNLLFIMRKALWDSVLSTTDEDYCKLMFTILGKAVVACSLYLSITNFQSSGCSSGENND